MIKQILTLPLLVGLNINAPIKNANGQNNFTLQLNNWNNEIDDTEVIANTPYTCRYIKKNTSGYNDGLTINAYVYNQTTYTSNNKFPIDNYAETYNYQTTLYQYEITPTNRNVFNLKTQQNLGLQLGLPTGKEWVYSLKIATTTDNYASNYMDFNFDTRNQPTSCYNSIVNSQNGFTYNETIKEIQATTPINIDQEIQIVNTKTNYVFMLLTLKSTNTTFDATYQGTTAIFIDGNITMTGIEYMGTLQTEVVDIPGLMFNILTMPFTFISMAFNLTLWPGTPYQINISNLFLSIIGILVFIFIIKQIAKVA